MKLHLVAKAVLILWLVRNFAVIFPTYGLGGFIGYTVADIRVWLLVIGLAALHYRAKKSG